MFWWQTTHVDVLIDGYVLGRGHIAIALATVTFSENSSDNDQEDDGKGDCECDKNDKADSKFVTW
jgi:hypothetical protein